MNWLTAWQALVAGLTDPSPVLPGTAWLHAAMPLAWGVVLASGVWAMLARAGLKVRIAGAFLALAVCLIPGPASPAYWLNLAFQMPSLLSGVICMVWAISSFTRARRGLAVVPRPLLNDANLERRGLLPLLLLGCVLGWALLLDVLAVWPVAIYPWGFASCTLALALAACTLALVFAGAGRLAQKGLLLVLAVLAVFVVTRLPSGNVWDAVLDPWLWLALHIAAWREIKGRWRAAKAIRD